MEQPDYRDILMKGPLAYACHQVFFNSDRNGPDIRITEANQQFASLCGLNTSDLVNRRLTDVLPGLKSLMADWPAFMAELSLSGKQKEFSHRFDQNDGWHSIRVYSISREHCITLIHPLNEPHQISEFFRSSERRFQQLYETMALGVVYQNEKGEITGANPAAERILGLSLEQMMGKTSIDPNWKSVHEDGSEYPGTEHPSICALRTGKPVLNAKMGIYNPVRNQLHWILINAIPEFRPGEVKPYQVYATFLDITAIKDAEDERKEIEMQFKESEKISHTGYYNINVRTGTAKWSDETFRIFGMDPETETEPDLTSFAGFVHPDDVKSVYHEFEESVARKRTFDLNYRIITRNSTIKYIHSLGYIRLDGSGNVDSMFGIYQDITERTIAENSLRESEERFRASFSVSPDMISMTRLRDGLYVDVNEAFVNKSGYKREEIIGNTALTLNIWNNAEDRDKLISVLKEKGVVLDFETEFRLKGGRVITGLMSASLVNINGEQHLLAYSRDITERKRTETALRQSEVLYRTVVSAASDGIILQDREGKILTWNKAAERIFGLSAESVIGKTSTSMSYNAFREDGSAFPAVEHPSMITLKTGKPVRNVLMRVQKNTDEFSWITINTSPVFEDENRKPALVVISFSDITKLKLSQEALLASAAVAQSIPSGLFIYQVEPNNRLILSDCNPAAEKLTGINLKQYGGKEFNEIWPGKNNQWIKEQYLEVVRTSKPFFGNDFSYEDDKIQGVYKIVAFAIDRNSLGVAFEDITALKNAENEILKAKEKAEENETLLRAIIENAPFEIWARDMNQTGILENQNSVNHFGSIIGQKPDSGNQPEQVAALWKRNNDRVLNGEILNEECFYQINGENTAFQQIAAPIKKGGITEGIVGFNINVNERFKAREEIRKLNGELEKRVEERTLELQLVNKELEAFAYTVSHDLRAPLRAIDGFTNILKEDYEKYLDEGGKKVLDIITENTSRMGILIDDLLAFSRLSRSEINLAQLDMTFLAEQAYKELTTNEQRDNIRFKAGLLPRAYADPSLIKQVWINLLSNAIKFSSKTGIPEITVSGQQEGAIFVYRITDNGVGFNMKYAGKLFGVFQRLHSVKEFEGTGVGLAIVQRIVVRHGGTVWAHAEAGKGASFFFSLPVRQIS